VLREDASKLLRVVDRMAPAPVSRRNIAADQSRSVAQRGNPWEVRAVAANRAWAVPALRTRR
jgi:hypothetical protein